MVTFLVVTLRTAARRLVSDRLVVAATALVALVGLVQLAAVPIYVDAVTDASFHRILADAPTDVSSIVVELRASPDLYGEADRVVSEGIADAVALSGAIVTRRVASESFEVPNQTSETKVDLTVLMHVFEIDRHTTLIDGAWPSLEGVGSVSSVLEAKRAASLGLKVGDIVELGARRDRSQVTIEIVGLYEIVDSTDPFWSDDTLLLEGLVDGRSFRTVGPFIVSPQAITSGQLGRVSARWQINGDLDSVSIDSADLLRSEVAGLEDKLKVGMAAAPSGVASAISGLTVETRLPELLSETTRSLTVTRSAVTAVVVQLALLAALALTITARLVISIRRSERELLAARGATRAQTLAISLFESSIVVAPAVLVAPPIAAWLLDISAGLGPLGSIELDIKPISNIEAFITVALSGLVMVTIFAWPSIRRSPTGTSAISHIRQSRQSVTQRAGIDIALVVLTGVAFWQLRALGPQKAASLGGRFSVDPVLVLVPALALLTAAVATLRLIPVIANLSERQAAWRRSAVAALAAWQIARRPASQAQAAFLLVMALSIGFFAATYSATWAQSQFDRANHQVGADIRLIPNRRTNDSLSDLHLRSAHGRLDGVAATMSITRRQSPLPGSDRPGWFLLIESERASDVVKLRDGADGFRDLAAQLADARPTVPAIAVPDETSRLEIGLKAIEEPIENRDGEVLEPIFKATVKLVLQDGNAMLHNIDVGSISSSVGVQTLSVDLTEPLGNGEMARPVDPISIVDIQLQTSAPTPPARTVSVVFVTLRAFDDSGTTREVALDSADTDWRVSGTSLAGLLTRQSIAVDATAGGGKLCVRIDTGSAQSGSVVIFSLRPGLTTIQGPIPVIVSRDWFASTQAQVGDVVQFPDLARIGHRGQIIGVVETFPTVDPTVSDFMLIDMATVQIIGHVDRSLMFSSDEAWIDLADGVEDDVVISQLSAAPYESFRVDGSGMRNRILSTDPAALAAIGAFFIGFVGAAVFSVVVFALSTVVSARERASEFTLVRALGLSPGQFRLWMAVEGGAMLILSIAMGTLIGWFLSVSILPLIALDQDGRAVVPAIDVVYPWASIALVEVMPVLAMLVIISVTSRRRRYGSLAAGIRVTDS